MTINLTTLTVIAALSLTAVAHAQQSAPEDTIAAVDEAEALTEEQLQQQQYLQWAEAFQASLQPITGEITLLEGKVSLQIPDDYYYLSPQDTKRVLEEAWGNPESDLNLGMIFPAAYSPLDAASWGVTLEYANDGYVSDSDAADIDYDELLTQMRDDTEQESQLRQQNGYDAIKLIGWAEPPYYDPNSNKLYWAKELQFADSEDHTLNYNVRALGRQGFLVMNFIANMSQLEEINDSRDEVLAMTSFNDGHKYDQFDPELDDVAAYGIGGLIAGKVLAKTGLFAMALLLLKKFWFVLLLPVWWLKGKLFKKSESAE